MTRKPREMFRLLRRRDFHDESGSAGVEFALIAPLFVLILAAIIEIGLVIRAESGLISAVSAAANHTLAIGGEIDDSSARNVASTIVGLLAGGERSATVNLNNAVTAHLDHGTVSVHGNGSGALKCYCASRPEGLFMWGASAECGAPCADGSVAGRFVEITARVPFNPILGLYGTFTDQTLHNSAVLRLP